MLKVAAVLTLLAVSLVYLGMRRRNAYSECDGKRDSPPVSSEQTFPLPAGSPVQSGLTTSEALKRSDGNRPPLQPASASSADARRTPLRHDRGDGNRQTGIRCLQSDQTREPTCRTRLKPRRERCPARIPQRRDATTPSAGCRGPPPRVPPRPFPPPANRSTNDAFVPASRSPYPHGGRCITAGSFCRPTVSSCPLRPWARKKSVVSRTVLLADQREFPAVARHLDQRKLVGLAADCGHRPVRASTLALPVRRSMALPDGRAQIDPQARHRDFFADGRLVAIDRPADSASVSAHTVTRNCACWTEISLALAFDGNGQLARGRRQISASFPARCLAGKCRYRQFVNLSISKTSEFVHSARGGTRLVRASGEKAAVSNREKGVN